MAWTKPTDEAETSFNSTTLFFVQLCVSVLIGHLAHRNKFQYATEGSIALLVGMLTGASVFVYLHLMAKDPSALVFTFRTDVFFNVLLPPIIFNAGFSVKKKLFFANFVTLTLFGVLGTFISVAIISSGSHVLLQYLNLAHGRQAWGDSLALGTILSSTDSVATLQVLKPDAFPVLHSLVFGEGVINDATSLVILRALDATGHSATTIDWGLLPAFARIFVASLLLGVGMGMLSALVVRGAFVGKGAHSTDSEVLVTFLLAFLAYTVSESLELSGIFTVFFCGVSMSHYTWHSLSPSAKVVTVYLFRILSFGMELFLFIYSGFDLLSMVASQPKLYTKGWVLQQASFLAAGMLVLVMVARAAFLIPITALANMWRRHPISCREMVAVWWAGTMRGAVSIAMTYHRFKEDPDKELSAKHRIVELACILVVLTTTLGMSACTSQFMRLLLPKGGRQVAPQGPPEGPTVSALRAPLLVPGVGGPVRDLQQLWRRIDRRYLQPLLGGRTHQIQDRQQMSPRGALVAQAFGAVDRHGAPQLHDPSDIMTRPSSMLNMLAAVGPAASLRWMDNTGHEAFSTTLGDLDADELQVGLEQLAQLQQEMERGNPVPPAGPLPPGSPGLPVFRPGLAPAEVGALDVGARDADVEAHDGDVDAQVDALLLEEHSR